MTDGVLIAEEISLLEGEMGQLREEADRRNTIPGDVIDVTNSNDVPCNNSEDASPNHLREELDRLRGRLRKFSNFKNYSHIIFFLAKYGYIDRFVSVRSNTKLGT